MMRRHKLSVAIPLSILTLHVLATEVLAHGVSDPSAAHQVIDSALIPLIGLGAISIVSLVMWKRNRDQF